MTRRAIVYDQPSLSWRRVAFFSVTLTTIVGPFAWCQGAFSSSEGDQAAKETIAKPSSLNWGESAVVESQPPHSMLRPAAPPLEPATSAQQRLVQLPQRPAVPPLTPYDARMTMDPNATAPGAGEASRRQLPKDWD